MDWPQTLPPDETLALHMDVQVRCAHKFGAHYQDICRFVQAVRLRGARVTGIVYDTRRAGRPLQTAEVLGDYNKRASGHDDEYGLLVPPHMADRYFAKQGFSVMRGAQRAAFVDHLRQAMREGVRHVLVMGYYADDCLRLSVEDMAEAFPGLQFYVVADLCRAAREPYSPERQYAHLRNVHVVHSSALQLQRRPPRPTHHAPPRRRNAAPR